MLVLIPARPKIKTDINEYNIIIEETGYAHMLMPQLDDIVDYQDIKFSYKRSIYTIFEAEGISLYVFYENNYDDKKNQVLNSYTFVEAPGSYGFFSDGLVSDFTYGDYYYKVVYDEHSDTCKSFLIIGFNDAQNMIAYQYFYDPDLDTLDVGRDQKSIDSRMGTFMRQYFHYFDD